MLESALDPERSLSNGIKSYLAEIILSELERFGKNVFS